MISTTSWMRLLTVSVAALLCSCATVSVSDLSGPNFGVRVLPHLDGSLDPDPMAVDRGLYTPRSFQDTCTLGYSRCSQSQFNWSSWSP